MNLALTQRAPGEESLFWARTQLLLIAEKSGWPLKLASESCGRSPSCLLFLFVPQGAGFAFRVGTNGALDGSELARPIKSTFV